MNMHRMTAHVQATISLCNHVVREGALTNPYRSEKPGRTVDKVIHRYRQNGKLSTGKTLCKHLVRQDRNRYHYDNIVDREQETLVGFQISDSAEE
jgi:hypothetical protein